MQNVNNADHRNLAGSTHSSQNPESEALKFDETSAWIQGALLDAGLNPDSHNRLDIQLYFVSLDRTLQIKGSAQGIVHPFCGSCGHPYLLPVNFQLSETWCSESWNGALPVDSGDFSIFDSGDLTQIEPLSEALTGKLLETIRHTPFCGPACVPHGFPPHQWSPSCHSHPEKLI